MTGINNMAVVHYLTPEAAHHQWHNYLPKDQWLGLWDQETSENVWTNITNRKIKFYNQEERLSWGQSTKVIFSIKEEYLIAIEHHKNPNS
jgi:hypothetical protein